MTIPLLDVVVIIFGLSSVVLLICHRLRIPVVVGFLLTGILAGPHGLGAVTAVHDVEVLAEVGVVLLLFTIGLEFSLQHLLSVKKYALGAGTLQVAGTVLAGWGVMAWAGRPAGQAVFLGWLIALSSTAIVLKILQDRAEINSPHGQIVLPILIFQDIVIVPMMLFTPFLAGATQDVTRELLLLFAKGVGIIAFVLVSARMLVPYLLYQIARTRSRELFALSIVLICMAVAWLTSALGLSLALGAFLAGLIVSESEYSHQALSHVLPFRDIFTSFFFVSIGMLWDVHILIGQPGTVLGLTAGVLVLKAVIAGVVTLALGAASRPAIMTGLALCQVGEFSFILSRAGVEYGLLTGPTYQLFLAVSILTMGVTPFILAFSPRIAGTVTRIPVPERIKARFSTQAVAIAPYPHEYLEDHLIVIGYGVNGRNVARAARIAMIPYVIIEMNPETVRAERARGEPILYGDATQEAVLKAAGADRARVLVAAVPDAPATRGITALARRMNPEMHIIARTRFVREVGPLYELGANEVIPEEFETSIEIFTRVLAKYAIPRNDIEAFVAEVRADGYEMFRHLSLPTASLADLQVSLPGVEISAIRLGARSPLAGKTLAEAALRAKYSVTVVLIHREGQTVSNPDGATMLHADDVLVLLGHEEAIAQVGRLCAPDNGDLQEQDTRA